MSHVSSILRSSEAMREHYHGGDALPSGHSLLPLSYTFSHTQTDYSTPLNVHNSGDPSEVAVPLSESLAKVCFVL